MEQPLIEPVQRKGLGVFVSAVFIVGTMCGSGILAVPKALTDAGWIGIPLLIICGVLSSYTGALLGRSWTILCERYPQEYKHLHVYDPYPTIAYRAAGKTGKIATRFCIDATLFGGATVFLLLISGNISELIKELGHKDMSLCYWILITGGVLIPLTWLGTPKDFWQAGIIAAITTSIAAWLIVIEIGIDSKKQHPAIHQSPTMSSFFTAFGTILYSYGGASCFPTIQVDMKDPTKFPISVVIGIGTVLSLYLPVGIAGFAVYGDKVEPNIINSLPSGGISATVNILITSHLLMAFLIVLNPINQELEGALKIPDKFSVKRILLRTLTTALVMFVALTIPHFDVILSLVGGSTVAATNFIFPPLFYLLLARQENSSQAFGNPPLDGSKENSIESSSDAINESETSKVVQWNKIHVQLYVKVIMIEIILIGVICGISSTFFAIQSLANGDSGFTVPCYVDISVGD